jgi:Domain of unknown function (DUF4386)
MQAQFNETHRHRSKRSNKMNSLNKTSRIAGFLYLLLIPLGIFGMLYVLSTLIVPGDAASTARNIMASERLFRAGIASDSVVFLIEIVLTVMLYVLLRPVSKMLSLVAAFSRLAMAVIQGINLLNHFFVLLLLSSAGFLTVFAQDQLDAFVLLFLNAHEYGALIWGLFFGLHLFVLGYLVYKSGYMPRILGILLIIASLCYLTQSFGNILLPQYKGIFATIGFISILETAFPLWLVIRGVKDQQVASREAS